MVVKLARTKADIAIENMLKDKPKLQKKFKKKNEINDVVRTAREERRLLESFGE